MKLQITIDGRAYAVDVELIEEEDAPLAGQPRYVPPPPAPPQGLMESVANADPQLCRSPVAGLVIHVKVEPGQSIESGAVVLVLEAMKMETNIAAPRAATVKAVHVKPGDPVKANQVLVEFE